MGMSNMQVQQPMQQGGGKGMGGGQIPSYMSDDFGAGMSNPLAGMSNTQAGMAGQQADAQQRMAALAAAQQAQAANAGGAQGPMGGIMEPEMPRQMGGTPGQMGGKGGPQGQPGGKGGMQQPSFGKPNLYPNTVKTWDNASIMPRQGVGKGGQAGGYPTAATNFKYTPPQAQTAAPEPAQQPAPTQQPVPGMGFGY